MKPFAVLLGLALAACAVPAVPTPTPRVVEVTVPGPTQVIEVPGPMQTVEVAPQSCLDALAEADLLALENLDLLLGILNDYVDYPEENLEEFGARVEARIGGTGSGSFELDDGSAYFAAADQCRAATE